MAGEIAKEAADAAPKAASARAHPAVLAISSALALFLAFPPAHQGFLAWFALAPLFLMVEDDRRPRALYGAAMLGGLTFWGLAVSWVLKVHVLGYLILAGFLAMGWPLFLFLARVAVQRLRLPLMLAVPIVWVAVEYGRVFVLSGFPWFYLAHTQYLYPVVIQVSDLAGAWGLGFVMAMVNACWVDFLRRPLFSPSSRGPKFALAMKLRIGTVAGLLLGLFAYGGYRLNTSRFRPGPRLSLIQTNFPQVLGNPPPQEEVLRELARLVGQSVRDLKPPDLIVWPESSFPHGVLRIDPKLDPEEFARQVTRLDPDSRPDDIRATRAETDRNLRTLVERAGIPFVIGSVTYDFGPSGLSKYNSAILLTPGAAGWTWYHKQLLVPFGEYIPLVKVVPALLWLTPYHDGYMPGLAAGRGPGWFDVAGIRYAPLICFEDSSPDLARRAFLGDGRDHPPDVLLNLTNDGWFHGTAEHQTHLAVSVFRAVECRVPLARAVNTGISGLIDGNGVIRDRLPQEKADQLAVDVPLDDRSSLYLLGGDWLPLGCAAITLGWMPLAWIRGRRVVPA